MYILLLSSSIYLLLPSRYSVIYYSLSVVRAPENFHKFDGVLVGFARRAVVGIVP